MLNIATLPSRLSDCATFSNNLPSIVDLQAAIVGLINAVSSALLAIVAFLSVNASLGERLSLIVAFLQIILPIGESRLFETSVLVVHILKTTHHTTA